MAITSFSSYIESLCTRHEDILHSLSKMHFVDSDDEKSTSIDSLLCYPAVILLRGAYQYTGTEGSIRKSHDYSLFVLDHVSDTGDYTQIKAKQDKCEQILDELLNKIVEDKRARLYPFLLGFSLSGTDADRVENNDDALYGVVAEFSLAIPYGVKNCRDIFLPE